MDMHWARRLASDAGLVTSSDETRNLYFWWMNTSFQQETTVKGKNDQCAAIWVILNKTYHYITNLFDVFN